jgi:hypothetical protein
MPAVEVNHLWAVAGRPQPREVRAATNCDPSWHEVVLFERKLIFWGIVASFFMASRFLFATALAAALATAVSAVQQTTSLMFQVEPKTEDCVHEDLKAGSSVDAQILVTRGGKLDVRFRVSEFA